MSDKTLLDPRVTAALALMETHLEDPIPIFRIAESLGLTQRTLQTLFHRAFATTPAKYYRATRSRYNQPT